jgi:hypothetical protein
LPHASLSFERISKTQFCCAENEPRVAEVGKFDNFARILFHHFACRRDEFCEFARGREPHSRHKKPGEFPITFSLQGKTMTVLRFMGASLLFVASFNHPAEASKGHHRHHYSHHERHHVGDRRAADCMLTNNGRRICGPAVHPTKVAKSRRMPVRARRANARISRVAENATIIGSRPAGCPHAYCGCGLRKFLGLTDTRLNLASNWARLFRHEPGPRVGLAAVRSGHVMYIEGQSGHGQWIIRDYNSGGGLSRIHVRSVRGYAFVNPNARVASR